MLKEIFKKQKESLDYFFACLDMHACERLVEQLLKCQGTLFLTGIGKSGYIAQKIAATLMSTGTKAHFLSPIDALHGDIGMVDSKDFVLIFSKSGETDELLQLLPSLRNKKVFLVAVTSNSDSRLAKAAHFSLELPCLGELCPFDLAPTTSSEIQLLFGDVLTVALMRAKGFTVDAYAENHPGGHIGRRASMRVKDIMLDVSHTPICKPSQKLEEVLVDFSEKKCGCLVVIDEAGKLQGIFTDGDLRRALQEKGEKVLKESLGSLMTPSPRTIDAHALAWEAMKIMEGDQKKPIMVLPVLEDAQKVVGLIKMHDLIQAGI